MRINNPISFIILIKVIECKQKPSMIFNNANLIDSLTKNKDIEFHCMVLFFMNIIIFQGPYTLACQINIEFNTVLHIILKSIVNFLLYQYKNGLSNHLPKIQDNSIKLFIKHNFKHYKFYGENGDLQIVINQVYGNLYRKFNQYQHKYFNCC